MNNFLTKEGGQPIWLGDIDFMQQSWQESVRQIVASLTGSSTSTCVLYGCKPDSNGGTTAGVISLNGEIMPVKESRLPWQGSSIMVVTEKSSERTFKNGSKVLCHETRYAILADEGLSTADIPHYDYQNVEFGSDALNLKPGSIKVVRHAGLLTISGYISLEKQDSIRSIEVASLDFLSPISQITDFDRRTLAINSLTPYTPVPVEIQVRSNTITIRAYPGPDNRTDQYSFNITI